MLITSYLIGLATFSFAKTALDWEKEKKRIFQARASGSNNTTLVYPTSWLAGLHVASLGVSIIFGFSPIAASITSILIPSATLYISFLRKKRQHAIFEDQVEPLLTSIANSLYGNPGIINALREAKDNAEQPMKKELARVLTDIDNGSDICNALGRFSRRIGSEIIELAVDGILICHETGGNLSNLLEGLSTVARTRTNLKGKIKAVTAQQKTTATLVAVIPIIFVFMTHAFSPTYQEHLSSPSGIAVIAYAVISVSIGFAWLKRMTDIRFAR